MSNMHTALIAHTAQDSLSIYTGLYGDRHGMSVSNSYKTYHPDGTTEPDGSFVYWTSPVYQLGDQAASAVDASPVDGLLAHRPGRQQPANKVTPAPWVPFTRAGCSVGDFSTANMVLENVGLDIPTVFGAELAEAQQLAADPSSFKDPETADYVGVAVHCAQGDAVVRQRPGREVRTDGADPQRGRRSATGRAGWLHRLPGTLRAPLRGSADRCRYAERAAQRLRSDERGRQPRRPRRSRAPQHVRQPAGLPGLQSHSPTSRSPTSPTCRRPASR